MAVAFGELTGTELREAHFTTRRAAPRKRRPAGIRVGSWWVHDAISTGSLGIERVWHPRCMTLRAGMPVLRLVARLHVDLLRVSSAACLPAA